ncbi:MAG: hypothetical protein ACJ8AI_18755 [Rhodopila sp.]
MILEDDLDGFVSAAADWIAGSGWNMEEARAGSETILQTYSSERERDTVLSFFNAMLQRLPDADPAPATITVRDLVVPYRGPLRMMAGRLKSRLEQMIG